MGPGPPVRTDRGEAIDSSVNFPRYNLAAAASRIPAAETFRRRTIKKEPP